MSVDISIDFTSGIEVEIQPRQFYTPQILHIEGKSTTVSFKLTDEQLSEIAQAIHDHLGRIGSHEHPDEQRALNHELEEAAGNA